MSISQLKCPADVQLDMKVGFFGFPDSLASTRMWCRGPRMTSPERLGGTRVFGFSKYVTALRKESVRRSRVTTRLDKARNDFTADLKMFTLRTQLERLES